MKVIVDVGVGRAVELVLRSMGHDVFAVRDIDPAMTDSDILDVALRDERFLITMDKDFGELVYRRGLRHSGVLLLRLEGATSAHKAAIVREIMELRADDLFGRFSVFHAGHLRLRRKR